MSYDKKEFIYILYFVIILMKIQNIHLFFLWNCHQKGFQFNIEKVTFPLD